MINNYEIGWNYPPKDSLILAQIIVDIIERPHELKRRSSNAMKLFKTNYRYGIVYSQLVDKLERIINEK